MKQPLIRFTKNNKLEIDLTKSVIDRDSLIQDIIVFSGSLSGTDMFSPEKGLDLLNIYNNIGFTISDEILFLIGVLKIKFKRAYRGELTEDNAFGLQDFNYEDLLIKDYHFYLRLTFDFLDEVVKNFDVEF